MEDIYVIEKIKSLCEQRYWTYYKLAKQSNIPYSSLNTMINKKHIPSISNLIKICNGFNITLSQFFANEDSVIDLTNEQQEFITLWNSLNNHSKNLVKVYIYGLLHKSIPLEVGDD